LISVLALALVGFPASPKVLGRVWAIDPCRINGVDYAQHQLPVEVPTGLGGQTVETFRGSARLRIDNAGGGQVGSIVLVGGSKVDFKKSTLLFPVGFTLNWGTIDCDSNPNECQINVNAGSCSVVTTGTHFLVERVRDTVTVEVYDGTVVVTPLNASLVTLASGSKGTLGPKTGGGIGFNYGWLTSKDRQDHRKGPAHVR